MHFLDNKITFQLLTLWNFLISDHARINQNKWSCKWIFPFSKFTTWDSCGSGAKRISSQVIYFHFFHWIQQRDTNALYLTVTTGSSCENFNSISFINLLQGGEFTTTISGLIMTDWRSWWKQCVFRMVWWWSGWIAVGAVGFKFFKKWSFLLEFLKIGVQAPSREQNDKSATI